MQRKNTIPHDNKPKYNRNFKLLRKSKKTSTNEGIFDMFDNVEYTDDDDMYFPRKKKTKDDRESGIDKISRLADISSRTSSCPYSCLTIIQIPSFISQ